MQTQWIEPRISLRSPKSRLKSRAVQKESFWIEKDMHTCSVNLNMYADPSRTDNVVEGSARSASRSRWRVNGRYGIFRMAKARRLAIIFQNMSQNPPPFRTCLLEAIPEIAEAARYLSDAVAAHLAGNMALAEKLICRADIKAVWDWSEMLWGPGYFKRYQITSGATASISSEARFKERMPCAAEKRALHERDGFHCRFCGIPLIRPEVRNRIRKYYPTALRWGRTNAEKHAAFQTMAASYDHILPYSKGGNNDLENLVVVCAPCNCARFNRALEEVGLIDPRSRSPVKSTWDGLERFR